MSDPMQNLNDAADALNQVAARAGGFWDDADARVAAKEAEVDAFLAQAEDGLTRPVNMAYDVSLARTKTSLGAVANAADNTRSDWIEVAVPISPNYLWTPEGRKAVLYLQKSYAVSPGKFENPQYSADWSYSRFQFVLASFHLDSDGVDARLAELALTPGAIGGENSNASAAEIPIVVGAGNSSSCTLRVRFINETHPAATGAPQEITAFGGNSVFHVDRVAVFNV